MVEQFNFDISDEFIDSALLNVNFNRVEEDEFSFVLWYTYDEDEDYVLEIDMDQDEVGILIAGNKVSISVTHSKIMEMVEELEKYMLSDDVDWVQTSLLD